jgi:hypothetical protein
MAYQYFDGYPIAGSTQQFLVTFASETDLDSLARAQAILESCESDLDQLQVWFKTDFRAGSPYAIWVHVASYGGGGSNNGYDNSESSRIFRPSADSTFKPPALPRPASLFARILPRGLEPAGLKSAPGLQPRASRPLTLSPDGVATIRADCGTSPAIPTADCSDCRRSSILA